MVIDIDEASFATEVLERSRTQPVVVDFWASWCGPCRQLGPLLEREAEAREDDVVLAKVDTDANPGLSQAYGIQGIPAVKAFRDGQVVDEFVGAQPPALVERFFDRLVPSEAERLAAAGDEPSLRRALELEPGRADAALPLARLLMARGAPDEALTIVDRVRGSFPAEGLAARLRLQRDARPGLDPAWAALDADREDDALDALLDALPDAGEAQDDLRRVVVGLLDGRDAADPQTRQYRRRLAAALY